MRLDETSSSNLNGCLHFSFTPFLVNDYKV